MSEPGVPVPQSVGLRPFVQELEARYAATGLDAQVAKFREVYQPLRLYEELALARGLLERFLQTYETQNVVLARIAETNGVVPPRLLGPTDAMAHVRLVADLVKMIHSLEGAEVVAREQRRQVVRQIGRVVEEEIARTADADVEGWQHRLLIRIRDRWLQVVT